MPPYFDTKRRKNMTYGLIAMILIICTLVTVSVSKHYYWKGRLAGWNACEKMSLQRARECGYDMKKFWPDILQ